MRASWIISRGTNANLQEPIMRKKIVTPSSVLLLVMALCLAVIYIESSSFGSLGNSVCLANAVEESPSCANKRSRNNHW